MLHEYRLNLFAQLSITGSGVLNHFRQHVVNVVEGAGRLLKFALPAVCIAQTSGVEVQQGALCSNVFSQLAIIVTANTYQTESRLHQTPLALALSLTQPDRIFPACKDVTNAIHVFSHKCSYGLLEKSPFLKRESIPITKVLNGSARGWQPKISFNLLRPVDIM